ncbi:MAG: isoquinoline 1-oxidoreductase subunit beta, partial [Pseudomonadota bacterium]
MGRWTRRALLAVGGVAGGGLLLGVAGVAFAPDRLARQPRDRSSSEGAWLGAWLRITPDNQVVAVLPHCDMGQGVHTALAMMLADELDADWNTVRIEEAPAEDDFANAHIIHGFLPFSVPRPLRRGFDYGSFKVAQWVGLQVTGGSSSLRGTGQHAMRVVGAAARQLLREAAARRWQLPLQDIEVRDSRVLHAASGRSASFGELAVEAAQGNPPVHPPLKPRSAWKLMGTSVPRRDLHDKVTGSAVYGIDVQRPGLLHAALQAAPVLGGRLLSVDEAPARAVAGVQSVVRLEGGVAVVATSTWAARKGLAALQPRFDDAGKGEVSSASVFSAQSSLLQGDEFDTVHAEGDGAKALADAATAGARRVSAQYRVPFLAHATLEPQNATVQVTEQGAEVWVGVQDPLAARKTVAKVLDLEPEQVVLHNHPLGGGFGRRLPGCFDFLEQAAQIARAVAPAPVKLLWTREQDTRNDYYRPAQSAQLSARLDAAGRVAAWETRFIGGMDNRAARLPYAVPHQALRAAAFESPVREGSWRSVDHSWHAFFTESFVDELAHAAGQDPLAYRLAMLPADSRHSAVLQRVGAMSRWQDPQAQLPAGQGRGVALVEAFGTIIAMVVEVDATDLARLRVTRVWAAVDCGPVIHPDNARAQIEGGIVFGLSAALFNEVTIAAGAVVQGNFDSLPMPRMADTPLIEVAFLDSDAAMGGLGEPGVPPVAPAVANALQAATGKRLRHLPLRSA